MTAHEFVSVIQRIVRDASVPGVVGVVRSPSGRRPSKELLALSEWFNGLEEADQTKVTEMLKLVAHSSVFGFLCVLDGARVVESSQSGHFELRYVKDGQSDILSGPQGGALHELLAPWNEDWS